MAGVRAAGGGDAGRARRVLPRVTALATAVMLAATGSVGSGGAARAAPACGPPPQTTAPTSEAAPADVPWPQRRYAPQRLAALATGAGVRVAVIDSGVDRLHAQLRDRVEDGRDYLDRDGDGGIDCAGHGTAVAAIIAARPTTTTPVRGLAPAARIVPVRVSEQTVVAGQEAGRTVLPDDLAAAIDWAVEHGADVLNLSVVLYRDEPAIRAAIGRALAEDTVVVAAVGNLRDRGDPVPYPAAYPGVLGVGAIGPDGTLADFSQVGSYVDLVAPGVDVLTTTPGGGHVRRSGTSYATPFVSATAALIRQYRPDLTAAAVAARIVATADPAPGGSAAGYGAGVLNPHRAVTETVPVGTPAAAPAAALATPTPDSAAPHQRRAAARDRSFAVAGLALAAVLGLVLAAAVLPRGGRRRWRAAGSG